jgi:hypothetical protein
MQVAAVAAQYLRRLAPVVQAEVVMAVKVQVIPLLQVH